MTDAMAPFLFARIAEDESLARQAQEYPGNGAEYLAMPRQRAPHVMQWDPTRVLAECQAKRRIVQEWLDADASNWVENETQYCVRFLAQIYRNHPDYQTEWSPGEV